MTKYHRHAVSVPIFLKRNYAAVFEFNTVFTTHFW